MKTTLIAALCCAASMLLPCARAQQNEADRQALAGLRTQAEKGDAKAQFNLGDRYRKGEGVTQDMVEAVKWYRKAAEQGHAEGQCALGACYGLGVGVAKDPVEEVKWFRKAAEQGLAKARCNLGVCYYTGEGVAKDAAEAAKYFRKAAEQDYAEAHYNLGNCYLTGEGVAKDPVEAAKWYRKAAEQGHAVAQYNLGNCYLTGVGAAKDVAEAAKWFRKAAEEEGFAAAQYELGVCCANGEGATKDAVEAAKWFRKAAEQGHANAQYALGLYYGNGEGVAKDPVEAVKWFRKAAEQNHAMAQNNLGNYYFHGQGLAKDEVEAATVPVVPVPLPRARSTPHFIEAVRPARLAPEEVQQELTRKLSREELALVVNPIQINSAMKHWAHGIANSATNDAQRARLLFEALANRARGRGQGGTRTAQEVFEAWGDLEQSFSCQESARLYLGLARELGIESYYVHVEKDDEEKPVNHDHDCAIVFLNEGAWLVDLTHHGFGVSHKQFKILSDIEMTAHHAMQWRNDGRNMARCQVGLKLHPDFAWSHLALAKALMMEDRAAEALKQIDRALTLEPNRWDAYLIRGMVAGRNGDPSRARSDLEKARSLNPENPEVHFRLGEALVDLRQWEVALDSFRTALRYADQYHDDLIERARENVAEIEETLAAVSGDPTALAALRSKAESGDPVAQNNLALYLSKQPNPDYSEIVKWLTLAAKKGYGPAQSALGYQYAIGKGVELNLETALDWYRRAADQEHPEALYRLAVMYFQGKGVAADPQTGLNWGRRAAERGHTEAQFALGMSYYEGKLVKEDFVEAHKWFSLAERFGNPQAKPLLREIELFMTPEQIAQARKQVQEWKVKTSPQAQPRPSQPSQ